MGFVSERVAEHLQGWGWVAAGRKLKSKTPRPPAGFIVWGASNGPEDDVGHYLGTPVVPFCPFYLGVSLIKTEHKEGKPYY